MIPTILHLGPIPLHSFGLMMMLAFLASWRRLWLNLRDGGERPELAESLVTWAAVGGIVGARLGYLLSFPQELLAAPWAAIFNSAGFVFHWGFVGGVLACWWVLRTERTSFWRFADLVAPVLAIGYAVGRVGCQLSGDGDYGLVSNLPWAMSYSLGVVPTRVGELVHPTPVYESFVAIAIALFLQYRLANKAVGNGHIFGCYLALSALARFFVECWRTEPVVRLSLTQAQLMSIFLLVAGLLLMLRSGRRI